MRFDRLRKFFGRPTGSSPRPQQSRLAFQRPHTTKAVEDEHEEVDGIVKAEDREEANAVKNEEDVVMNSKSEVHRSSVDTKHTDPVLNGRRKSDFTLANGKGGLFI